MFQPRLLLASCVLVLMLVAGCERPFVEESPPAITILSPNLSTVVADPNVVVEIGVTSELRAIDTVQVNGRGATFDATTQTYRVPFTLSRGVNALRIEAVDVAGNVSRATRYGVFLPASFSLETSGARFVAMPQALGGHAAVRLADGRVLITGGTNQVSGEAVDRAYLFDPTTNTFDALLAGLVEARTGHTASLLPDGRVLLVGGARTSDATSFSDFVSDAELFDPRTDTFTRVPMTERSPAVIRMDHAAHIVTVDGDLFVYLIGGRGRISTSGTTVGTRSDFRLAELVAPDAGSTTVSLDDPLAVGPTLARTPTSVSSFTFTPLGALDTQGFGDFLLAGTYVPPNNVVVDSVALAITLGLNPSYDDVPVQPMSTARVGHAGAVVESGLVLVAGGQVLGTGAPVPEAEVYAQAAGRFFAFPLASGVPRLNVPRYRHTATKLADGRILILGGFDRTGMGITLAEFFLTL